MQGLGPARAEHRLGIAEPVLALQYVENTGGAFGFFRGQTALLTVMALVVIGALVLYYRRVVDPSPWLVVSLGLLLGGALGNLVDRIRLGYVVDFVAVGPWPKFNVADSAITIGVLLVAWATLTGSQPVIGGSRAVAPEPAPIESSDIAGPGAGNPAGHTSEG